MKTYTVGIPITGVIYLTLEAEDEQDAIAKAMESDDLTLDNLEEWEPHEVIAKGNVCYASTNYASAMEVS